MKTKIITLFTGLLAISGMANATIVHTDINDETLASGGTINIDMNNDATNDFTFTDGAFGGSPEPAIMFNPDAGFVMEGTFASGSDWDVISGLTFNTVIDGSANFANNGADGYIDPFWGTAMFPTDMDYYIGSTFKIGANTHFGWIKVNWDGNGTFIVKEFAYEDQADVAINAGATAGAGNVDVTTINLTSAGNAITVATNNTLQITAEVLPNNASNQDVTWSVINGAGTASIDQNGLLTGLTVGLVTVKATADDGSGTEGFLDIEVTEDVAGINENNNIVTNIYPNPVLNQLTIEVNKPGVGNIYTQNGQLVQSFKLTQNAERINVADLTSGIYFLTITTEGGQTTKKLIKN
jgi:hypothetical protein